MLLFKMEVKLSHWQTEVWDDTHRYKVINAGRRAGKTMLVTLAMADFASRNSNKNIWYIAPTYRQAKQIVWEMLKQMLPKEMVVKWNETDLTVALKTGCKISLKGADNPDSLRGVSIDLIMFDEVAFFARWDEVWKILRPTLADSMADVWFISTPNGFNHFKHLSDNWNPNIAAKLFEEKDVKYFHFTTYDNPHIPKIEIEAMRNEMDEDSFAQEILGEFRKMTGLVFKDFDRATHMVKIDTSKFNSNWTFTRALDFGFNHKAALGYFAISPDQREIYMYDGIYQNELTEHDIANVCIVKDAGKVITNPVADSAQPMSIAELKNYGVKFNPVVKGKDSVKNGITKLAELLKVRKDTGKPTLMFNSSLDWVATEMEKYRWMERKTDGVITEVPYKKDDDAIDMIRYFSVSYKNKHKIKKKSSKKKLVYSSARYM